MGGGAGPPAGGGEGAGEGAGRNSSSTVPSLEGEPKRMPEPPKSPPPLEEIKITPSTIRKSQIQWSPAGFSLSAMFIFYRPATFLTI